MVHIDPRLLCLAGMIVVFAGYVLVWAVCAASAEADDWDEQVRGIRRS
jgi:hypothetical protein